MLYILHMSKKCSTFAAKIKLRKLRNAKRVIYKDYI